MKDIRRNIVLIFAGIVSVITHTIDIYNRLTKRKREL